MSEMTDLDDLTITRLCAEAMGFRVDGEGVWNGFPCVWRVENIDETHKENFAYYPLGNDAQAMALVKTLFISCCGPDGDNPGWDCYTAQYLSSEKGYAIANNENLNRAICECIAKLQLAKAHK